MKWIVDEGGHEVSEIEADTAYEAAEAHISGYDEVDESTAYVVYVMPADGDEDLDRDSRIVVVHPPEPECEAAEDGGHVWSDDHELVGGCEQNPGIQSVGGAAIQSTCVCTLCGMADITTSASQGYDTEHDHDTQRWEPDHVSIEELVKFHGDEVPDGLRDDSELARALPRPCGCTVCDCTDDISDDAHIDENGVEVCGLCARGYTDNHGEFVCHQTHNPESEPCPECNHDIEWGAIQTGGPGAANSCSGNCACRTWTQQDLGGRNHINWQVTSVERLEGGRA